MSQLSSKPGLARSRAHIADKVLQFRKERRWTQAELAARLDLSQSRLSEIERGAGSFTAEQLFEIARLFNVATSDFAPRAAVDPASELQDALARLGATHLHESGDVLPSERLKEVGDAVRETLVAAELPRLVAALAPILVANADRINLKLLHSQLAALGLARRLPWVAENTLVALQVETPAASPGWRRRYHRARGVLETFLSLLRPELASPPEPLDVLDSTIRSKKTLQQVQADASAVSRRWGILTALQPDDFARALRGARGSTE
ncbi:MAG: helix-turn-helix domain-containing protein [Polyangiaceae bacterium]